MPVKYQGEGVSWSGGRWVRRSLQHVAKPDIGLSGPAGAGYPAAPRRSLLGARDRLSASTPSPQRPLPPMGWATRRVPRGPAQPPEPKADPWPELVAGGIPCPPNASSAHLATSSAFMASESLRETTWRPCQPMAAVGHVCRPPTWAQATPADRAWLGDETALPLEGQPSLPECLAGSDGDGGGRRGLTSVPPMRRPTCRRLASRPSWPGTLAAPPAP